MHISKMFSAIDTGSSLSTLKIIVAFLPIYGTMASGAILYAVCRELRHIGSSNEFYVWVNLMPYEQGRSERYDATIDSSMEASVQKALLILAAEQEAHEHKLQRPDIDPRRGLIKIMAALLFFGVLFFALHLMKISLLFGLPLVFLILLLNAKKTILWMILLYQKYAPEQIRSACVFTPSCSEYMILAIHKYGLLKGVLKGTQRLLRCHQPNGGIDDP